MRAIVINLDKRSARWERLQQLLPKFGLKPVRCPGVVRDDSPVCGLSPPEYGCYLAHMNALRMVEEPTVIFEDDVMFVENFQLPPFEQKPFRRYQMILLGATQYHWKKVVRWGNWRSQRWYLANFATSGLFAYYITPELAQHVLKLAEQHSPMTSDGLFKTQVYPNIEVPVLFPAICIPDVTQSDIRRPREQLQMGLKRRWPVYRRFQ